jgi:hypothetical protein
LFRALALALAVGAVLLWPAAAYADDYGGGRVPDTVVSLRTAGDSVVVRAYLTARCGAGAMQRRVPLAADGSFSLAATTRGRPRDDRRVRRVSRFTLAGRVVGSTASGTARVRLTFRRRGRVVGRCATGERRWEAGTGLKGLTSQAGDRPRAFLLGVDGARVTRAVFEYRLRCREFAYEQINLTPGGPIAADGTFVLRERFTLRYADARERFRVTVRGRVTPTGVGGRLSVTSVARSLAGRVIDRCRTGPVSFTTTR